MFFHETFSPEITQFLSYRKPSFRKNLQILSLLRESITGSSIGLAIHTRQIKQRGCRQVWKTPKTKMPSCFFQCQEKYSENLTSMSLDEQQAPFIHWLLLL
jgi:hypothetical protein